MANTFYPYFQPSMGYWGGVLRAILGRGNGKFRSSGYNYQPINNKLILIDTAPGSLMNVAMQVPQLNTVLSTGAEFFSLMDICHYDKNGNKIENSEVLKFLETPNPLQTLEQYLYEFYILNGVYNKTFQHKISGLSYRKIPSALWLLPSGWMRINATGKMYRQTDINEIIESYELIGSELTDTFETDKIIYMPEGVGNNVLNPISRVEALQIPLSNIMASMKSFNVIATERGMIGFIAPEGSSKDGDGALPFDKAELLRLRNEYQNQYNLDNQNGHVSFTHASMKWVPMTFDVSQLMLFEGTEDAFSAICSAYRHDRDIYPSVKGATYENKNAGLKNTIQNALQPLADKLMGQWTKHFCEEGSYLEASYRHLPVMQEDEMKEAQAELLEIQALSNLYRDGVINLAQYAEETDVELITQANAPNSSSQASLRGLVGSISGIVQINQYVAQGFIDKPTAVNILVSVFGYDIPTATSMITNTTVDASTTAP